jgi:hypothetical protein
MSTHGNFSMVEYRRGCYGGSKETWNISSIHEDEETSHHSTILDSAHIRKNTGGNDQYFQGKNVLSRASSITEEDDSYHSIILDSGHIRQMPQLNRSMMKSHTSNVLGFFRSNSGGTMIRRKYTKSQKSVSKDESRNALLDSNAMHGRRSLSFCKSDTTTTSTERTRKSSNVRSSKSKTASTSSPVPFQVLSPSFAVHQRRNTVAKTPEDFANKRLAKPPRPPAATRKKKASF